MRFTNFLVLPFLFTLSTAGCAGSKDTTDPVAPTPDIDTLPSTSLCNDTKGVPFLDTVQVCEDLDLDGTMNDTRCGNVPKDAVPPGCLIRYEVGSFVQSLTDHANGTYTDDTAYYAALIDCDDLDATVHPGAKEVPIDGIDQDCDGADIELLLYADVDQDDFPMAPELATGFYTPIVCKGDIWDPLPCKQSDGVGSVFIPVREDEKVDCNDTLANVYPDAPEFPEPNTFATPIDMNCDGRVTCFADDDGDGIGSTKPKVANGLTCVGDGIVRTSNDCDDTDPKRSPALGEIPGDDVDNNCDPFQEIDEEWTKAKAFVNIRPLPAENIHSFLSEMCFAVLSEDGEEQLPFTLRVNGGPPTRFDGYDCPIGSLRDAQTTRISTADFPGQVTFDSDDGQIVIEIDVEGFAYDVVALGHIWARVPGSTSTVATASAWKRPISRLHDDCSNTPREPYCDMLPVTLDLQRETMLMRSDVPIGMPAGSGPVQQHVTPDGDWEIAY